MIRKCSRKNCHGDHCARGLCRFHYMQEWRAGNLQVKEYSLKVPTYAAIHKRLRDRYGPAKNYACAYCGEAAREWALKHDAKQMRRGIVVNGGRVWRLFYSPRLRDYQPLCSGCHNEYDRGTWGRAAA